MKIFRTLPLCSRSIRIVLASVFSLSLAAHGAPPGADWTLTFSDEFNGQSTYDHAKWSPLYIHGSRTLSGNGEKEWYVDSAQNIDLSSGTSVKLTALANNPVAGYTYSSGMLSSHNYFNQAFGYFECYAKVPAGKGLWPAFWTLEGSKEGAGYSWPPEIDIMEHIGASKPKDIYMTNHYSSNYPLDGGSATGLGGVYTASQNISAGYHKFAVNWEPDGMTWYVDDIPRYSTTGHVPYLRAMHVILNLAVGGYWPGNPDATTIFPAIYEVDYVRVYSKALPSPWQAADVGAPTNAGRTYASSTGLMNVCGSGAGITGASDQFHFAYATLNGNGTIVARVKNLVGTNATSVAANSAALGGLMIRESLSANSAYALMSLRPVISGTAGGNVFSARTTTGGTATTSVLGNSRPVPSWLKLVRIGTTLTGYSSVDGIAWIQDGTTTISMGASVYAGLAVTGSTSTKRATAQFDNILITGSDTPVITSIVVNPSSSTMEPNSESQFSASARDQFGNAVSPQPSFSWSVSGSGTINSAGLYTAGTSVGGPFTVTATSGGVSGAATVSVVNNPNAPIGLTATPSVALPGWIKLNWTDNSDIEIGYVIERYSSSSGIFTPLTTVAANVTTYTNTGLNMPSGPYTYRVFASGTGGLDSGYSNQATATIGSAPAGPSGLTATAGVNKVIVSWSAVSGATSYNISRSTSSGGSYSVIKYNNSTTSYTDSTAVAGTTYYYKVTWVSGAGTSAASGPVSATPVGNLASIVVSPTSASVQSGATQQFSAVGKDAAGNDAVPQPTFTWSVSGGGSISSSGLFTAAAIGGPHTVTATSGSISGTTSVTVTSNGIPNAPSDLTPTWATMLNGWFKLTWTDNSSDETGFTVQSYNGTTWSTYATVAANATTYTRTGLNMPSGPYTMRVVANGNVSNSGASNQVTFSIPSPPAGPTGLTATAGSAQVVVSWTAVTGANSYNISRSITSTGGYSVIKYNNASTTYVDTNAVVGTTYYYKVAWVGSGGSSASSGPVSATPY